MSFNDILTAIKEYFMPLSALLILLAGIIDNSKKIAAKPLSKFLAKLGKLLNADLSERLDYQEAFLLNDFYQKHSAGKNMTKEQYENAISMFEKHLKRGANSVNEGHLAELKEYYHNEFQRVRREK